ncbi:MAG TPA: NAD(P)/FAD-dependent oxidoreductase [Terriglobales bacterium]|nr:NAD(P)/FAD-dependent oxidoreductase [Terriglobales bacterium]
MSDGNLPQVVIVGAGFGGLNAAQKLAKLPVDVTVLDRKNYHTFQPLLYQVATAGLSPGEIAAPIRGVLKHGRKPRVLLAEVVGFDTEQKQVQFRNGTHLPYDYLIVATGSTHSYFGHDDWATLAPGLKTIEDATEIRRRVLLAFELAERRASIAGKAEPVHFVIVGGGPTGVELAGTLAEIARKTIAQDFDHIDPRQTRILLIEGAPRVLPAYPEDLSRSAEKQLHKLGVEVLDHVVVTSIEPGLVRAGERVYPSTVTLWAAGVAASPLGKALGAPVDKHGRVLVNSDLSVPGHPEVFVIGDLANLVDPKTGQPLPGLAPVAIQQGRFIAEAIGRDLHRESRKPFHYHDKGTLATIGRAAAVADLGKNLHFSGFVAWMLWLFVHLLYLVGFRNRLLVLIEWGWSYLTYQRSARLITGSTQLPGWAQQQKLHETNEPSVENEHDLGSTAAD